MRRLFAALFFVSLSVGCQHPQKQHHKTSGGARTKPARSAELSKLEPLVGHWSGTAEMLFPDLPQGQPNSFKGEGNYDWTLDGMFLKGEGWYEMGAGNRAKYIEYFSWDPVEGKFHQFYMSDWGECGEGWMTVSADGKSFNMLASGLGQDQTKMKGNWTMTLVNDRQFDWTWTENSDKGTLKLQGTMHKQ